MATNRSVNVTDGAFKYNYMKHIFVIFPQCDHTEAIIHLMLSDYQ